MNYTPSACHRAFICLSVAFGISLFSQTVVIADIPAVEQGRGVSAVGHNHADSEFSSTRVLFNSTKQALGVELRNGDGINQIVLKTSASTPTFRINKYSQPSRLVLDIDGENVKGSQKSGIADLEFVSGIRIGAHPGKVRVVLDLAEGVEFGHSARAEKNAIVVTLSAHDRVEAARPSVEALPAVTTAPEVSALPAVALPASVDNEGISETSLMPVSAARNPAATDVAGKAQFSAAQFVKAAGQQQLKVAVSNKPEFSMARTSPSEYVLTLLNTAPISEAVTEPTFAEATDKMRSARAAFEEGNTLVRIFCDPSVFLTASRNEDGVVVEEATSLAKVADDIRAQIKPEAEKVSSSPQAEKKQKEGDPQSKSGAAKNPATPEKASLTAAQEKVASKDKGSNQPKEVAPVEVGDALTGTAAGDSTYTGRLISLDLQDTDIDNALRIIAEVSNLNIVASEEVTGKVTLRLLDVPWDQALDVILKSNGLDKVVEGNVMRIAPYDKLRQEREALKQARVAQDELAPVAVKYIRVSYAKASEIKSLVETVLSERGSAAYDERSNQLIIKDVQDGLKNVSELIKKVDLRTPQVLLETQIVEADRSLARELGSELGFQYIQSPSTGNGTGLNFPAAVAVGGSVVPGGGNILGSAFPVAADATAGSAISMLFDSADGTKTLEARLSQLESEGRAKVISRPAVATTNNKAAEIKSVKKLRIRLPNGGLSVATGAGASANGSGAVATETVEAGIILNVTPQASPDYYILLDIKAKSSSFSPDGLTDFPTEIERSASSTVLVSSGQTFALGGIYKIQERDKVSGVPFFKDIPFLGTFFRRIKTDNADEELLFFITPRIVEGSFDDASMKANAEG
jgi:type IV pilus secretin PilQ/predicted competence protein